MKRYIVSIRELDTDAPPLLQDVEVFKGMVQLSGVDESKICTLENSDWQEAKEDMLVQKVDQIQRIVTGDLTVDESEGT